MPESSYFPRWKLRDGGVVAPDERVPAGQTIALGVRIAGFTLGGIGTATFGAILPYQNWRDTPDAQ